MNSQPHITWAGPKRMLTNYGCGRQGLANDERAFWQSRATLAGQPSPGFAIVDPRRLCGDIKAAWRAEDAARSL